MATQTYEQLIAGANKIKENELPESNTHDLVGEQLLQMTNKMQEESTKTDNSIMEYNVSKFHPTSGVNGSNKYTLETAIAQVPSKYRSVGIKCAFVNEAGKPECWEYQGGSWTVASFKQVNAAAIDRVSASVTDSVNKQGIYNVDANVPLASGSYYTATTARAAVPSSVRKLGLIITYKTDATTSVTEQFIGSNLSKWSSSSYWKNTPLTEKHLFQYDEIFENIALSIDIKFRYKNYVIAYYNIEQQKYECLEYTRTIFDDINWKNKSYWKQITPLSTEMLNIAYAEIYLNQAFCFNRMARVEFDEAYNLLDVSKVYGIGIDNKGNVIKHSENEAINYTDHVVFAPIDVSKYNNVTIYSADISSGKTPILYYKYDSVGKYIGNGSINTYPYVLDTSDCSYLRIKSYRKTNLQIVPGREVLPLSSPMWAFRSLYSEGVILPAKLYYLDQFVIPYYVEAITTNNDVEVNGSFNLGIVNRKELFMPRNEGTANISLGYGYRSIANMQVSIKKARLELANKTPIILCIGDSFSEMASWHITLKENLESLGITPVFIGAMHSVNTILSKIGISENQTGGKLRTNFIQSVSGKCYIVNVTSVIEKEMPINYNRYVTYNCNGFKWTVWGYQLDEQGDGKIRLYCTDSSAILPTSGVLEKSSGTGDTTINYNGTIEVDKNPFYNKSTGKLDFNEYLTNWGYNIPHVVCLLFGANDMGTSQFNKTFWQDVQEFIETWHEQIPETKFVVGFSKLYRRYASDWGETAKRSIYYNVQKLNILYKDSDYVYICPTWANVDPINGFSATEVVASKRFPEVKYIQQGDVHPIVEGMQQIGDAMTPYVVDALVV